MTTPWQKIVRAAKAGRGLRLTSEECFKLFMDDAIETKATNDDIEQGLIVETKGMSLTPRRKREGD